MTPSDFSLTRARVDLRALQQNARVLRSLGAPAALMAVVKADAYGHGAVEVAQALEEIGVEAFAVATVPEGIALREAGVRGRILVFVVPQAGALPAYARYDLETAVSSLEAARLVAEAGVPLRVHLEIDTGIHRLGVAPEEAAEALTLLRRSHITLEALWTHYVMSDESGADFTAGQVARFEAVRTLAPEVPVHASNSYSLLTGHGLLPDAAFVRGGVALYGLLDEPTRRAHGLEEVMQFVSHVDALRRVEAGEGASYGWTWRAGRPTHVATIAAGYADGVRRVLSNRGAVGVGGRRYPIVGNVCMDAFMIDAGPADAPCSISTGDEVVLFGPGGPSADEVAGWAETIAYEVACGVGARVPRCYC